jgi:hypothetical protein
MSNFEKDKYVCTFIDERICSMVNVTVGKFYFSYGVNQENNTIVIFDDNEEKKTFPLYCFESGIKAKKYIAKNRLKDL